MLSLVLFSIATMAQQRPGQERIRSLKIAFLTERLALTSEEAQAFWPIYNEHEKTVEALRVREKQELAGRMASLMDMSDGEASKMLAKYMQLMKEKQEAQQRFVANLDGVISPKKIILLIKSEEDFKKRLLQQFRKRRAGQ
ncbi:hypothetical protein ABV409_10545 [Flagellimonas sp. DF-77]|uniref:hypothetical protein n=1 Tax=Flagellimonas algarum TaxID=3230298 RepID=UPI003396E367